MIPNSNLRTDVEYIIVNELITDSQTVWEKCVAYDLQLEIKRHNSFSHMYSTDTWYEVWSWSEG